MGNEHAANVQNKMYSKYRKYRSRKKVQIWWSKNRKIKSNLKNEELIVGYQQVEYLWNVLSQRQNLKANKLNLSYFGKQSFKGIVDLSYIYS